MALSKIIAESVDLTDDFAFTGTVTGAVPTLASEFKTHDNTLFYADFSESGAISGTNIQNLATGTSAVSKVLPLDGYTTSTERSNTVISVGSNKQGLRTALTGDEFDITNNGMTMGVLFKKVKADNTTAAGLIYYGDTGNDNHFFARLDFGAASTIYVGEDTGGSDTWTNTNFTYNQNRFGFFAVSIDTNGTMMAHLDGVTNQMRANGTVPTPTSAVFGIGGDPYNDNASNQTYASFFFYKGVATKNQINKEIEYLQSKWIF